MSAVEASAAAPAAARILYVVGFDATEAAVSWQVAQVSRARQAPIVLFATTPRGWPWTRGEALRRQTKQRLGEVRERLQKLRARVAGVKVAQGPRVDQALRAAREMDIDLVMIGAGDRALDDEHHVAFEAQALARHAPHDVWICKPRAEPLIDHVLCAAQPTAAQAAALEQSLQLCRHFNARLRLLSLMPEPPHRGEPAGADPQDVVDQARAAQQALLAQYPLDGVALSRASVWSGEPADEVVYESERYWDGLLVIAAPAPGALGATAERVLQRCASSLLVVKRRPQGAMPAATEPAA